MPSVSVERLELYSHARGAKLRPRLLLTATIALLCLGGIARARQYFARASFWGDEAFIVLNLRELSPVQLVGKLKFDQAAPPLFLLGMKATRALGGEGELPLRLEPFAMSILGLLAFGLLAWRALPPPGALLAVGLFALSRRLIEYAAEAKQYGCDAAIAALLLLVALDDKRPPLQRLFRCAVVAGVTVWFSHPTAIVFAGISAVLSVQCLRRSRSDLPHVIVTNAIFAVSLAVLYCVSIHPQHTDFLYEFWRSSFPDWHHPRTIPLWAARQTFDFLQSPYRWAAHLFGVLIVITLCCARRQQMGERVAMWAMPILLAIAAALVMQYPFNGDRLTLFLMPSLFLLVGAGAAAVWQLLPHSLHPLWWAVPTSLLGYGLMLTTEHLVHPAFRSHIRPAVRYAQQHVHPGDAVVLLGEPSKKDPGLAFTTRHLEALCYWPHPDQPLYVGLKSFDAIAERRFWILVAFTPGEPARLEPLIEQAGEHAHEVDHFIEPRGGAAYLFERDR